MSEERQVDADAARARGLTVVDLSDGWAPSILDGAGYRAVFTGLAADRSDGDGQPLAAGERNYLELYGIPPALSVLRRRFLIDAAGACARAFDAESCSPSTRSGPGAPAPSRRSWPSIARASSACEAARAAAGADDLQALAEGDGRTARDAKEHLRFEAERLAFAEVEKRLACEGLMDPRQHKPGAYDTEMRTAMLDFQQKHAVMDQADIKRATLEALARPPLENDFARARPRAHRTGDARRRLHRGRQRRRRSARSRELRRTRPTSGADGARHRVPDLATAARDATLTALGHRDARTTRSRSSAATRAPTSPG